MFWLCVQTEDPAEVKVEGVDVKMEVDPPPALPHPHSSGGQLPSPSTQGLMGVFHGGDMAPQNAGQAGEDHLNSSGEGHLDIGDMDVNMEEEALLQLVGQGEFLGSLGDSTLGVGDCLD